MISNKNPAGNSVSDYVVKKRIELNEPLTFFRYFASTFLCVLGDTNAQISFNEAGVIEIALFLNNASMRRIDISSWRNLNNRDDGRHHRQ